MLLRVVVLLLLLLLLPRQAKEEVEATRNNLRLITKARESKLLDLFQVVYV